MIPNISKKIRLACALLISFAGLSQEYNTFDVRYQNNIKGDLTFIANNIVNRDGGTSSTEPEDPYDATGSSSTYNDWLNMQYIDVDTDASTFSSSIANFVFPQASCNIIRYAGLYWSATYPSEYAGDPVGTGRQNDFNQVKFKVPGGTYVNITADEILFDGFTSSSSSVQQNSPYACYADVTSLITPLADPTGDYTVANIRSVVGSLSPGGGAAGGWTLVIVYENPTLSGKLITTFDGFARVRSSNPTVDINYSGFNTVPFGPVRAKIGAAALEGDNRITGDQMFIRETAADPFVQISNAANPGNNFFNSNITLDGVITTNRTPNSVNTLGYDTDIFLLNNPSNSVLDNAATQATFRFTSTGDQYYPFFNSFNVEIIEPNIILEKKVEDIAGNDITGLGVNLGQTLDYVLSFINTGNDDGANYTIRDVLPVNVTLDELNMVLPTGVTYTYDPLTRTVIFTISDNLIEIGDPSYSIRMRVKVAENCFDFIDACTDLIENLAYSTYEGVINNNQITDDPSVSDFDNCGFVTPGATNFLLDDLSDCDFSRTVQLCGDDVLLDAGDNFDDYIWYKDENGDNLIDAGDTVLNDSDPDNDPSTFLVNDIGTYIVDKIVADPCKGFQEIITVERFGDNTVNPIIDFYNTVNGDADPSNDIQGEIVSCSVDGDLLPKIFLCGINDSELLQVNIVDAQSIVWEQLDESSCASSGDDCANKNLTCTWNQVTTGNTYDVNTPGKYRLVVTYQNGCFNRFYFNVFQNTLDIQYTNNDIVCTTPGNITITNLGGGYGYQLVDIAASSILIPFSANNGPSFDINTNGAYRVEVVQLDGAGIPIPGACIFSTPDIGILQRDFQVGVTSTQANCNVLGSINIQVSNVNPNYEYELRLDDGSNGGLGTLVDNETAQPDNNFTFSNLNPDNYIIITRTDDGCEDIQNISVAQVPDLTLSALTTANIGCLNGTIQLTASGGFPNPDYNYAIWSKNGVPLYPTIGDIPGSAYQVGNIFSFAVGEEGDYQFVVVDANNCSAISNTVTIVIAPSVEYTTTAIDETCFGASDGSFAVNITNSNGYTVSYTLTYPDTSTVTNASGTFTGLPQGNYSLTITQTQGPISCDYVETFTIGGPVDGVTGVAVIIQDYTCVQNGTIEAQGVIGGAAPYEYSIDGINFVSGVGSETFSNLTDGTYTLTIRDASGCTFVTNPVTLDPLNGPTDLSFVASTPNCPTQTSDVTVTALDGNVPFTFEIVAPAAIAATSITGNTAIFNGLAPDTYTFRVTDNKSCSYDESFTILPVTPIGVVGQLINNITCFSDTNGEALFTVSGFNTSYDYTITGPAIFSGTSETSATIPLSNLDDGTYAITVTDNGTNCTATATVTIQAPAAALTLSANETQPTCTADGDVVLTATGGWGANNFGITYPDGITWAANTTGSFAGLVQTGTYLASATDANGCVATTSFNLNAAVAPILEIVPNAPCYDIVTGLALTANVLSGGDGNFEYSINGGIYVATNVFSGLAPGTHSITVRDGKNCTDTNTITIDPELTVTASAGNIEACGTTSDITITGAGGDGNFVYAVVANGIAPLAGDFAVTNPVTVTSAGDYDVYVRDNNGNIGFCEASYDITVTQDAPLSITSTATPVICFGETNGAISISVAGGSGPYQYSIDNGVTYQTTGSFVNLVAATYPIRIRDANNCEAASSITVAEPDQLVAEVVQTQNYTCLQLGEISVGSITPTTGGSGDYQYSLDGGAWTPITTGGAIFTNLMDGTYSIRVRDANAISCSLTLADVIIPPLPTEPTLSTTITYNCDGSGNITVLPNDVTYTYSIDGGIAQASNIFTNIGPGSHSITVNYGSDCTVETTTVVENGRALNAQITAFTNISCNGLSDGFITFEVDNFDAVNGFEYAVNGGAFSAPQTASPITVSGLSAGANTIEVRDVLDNTCSIVLSENLTEPSTLVTTATITDVFTCNNTGATITASVLGGTPTYEYQLEDTLGGIITAYQASNLFANVPAGNYIVRARDINNCDDPIDVAINVVAPSNPTFTATPTACYSGNNDGTIQVDITSLPGNGGFQFSLNGGPWMTPTPTTATTHTFSNLASGTYTIDVKDQFGCAGTQQSVTINPELTAVMDVVDISSCADGSITITANGGNGVYEYAYVPTTTSPSGLFGASNTFIVTTGNDGTYDVYVRDTTAAVPCEYMETVTINPATSLIYTTVPTDPECHDGTGSITVNITSGNSPYTIQIIDLDNGGASNETNFNVVDPTKTYYNLLPGNYTINVTDANGCLTTDTPITINNPDELTADLLGILPASCTSIDPNDYGFQFINYPTTLGTIEFSADGGTTWTGDNSIPGTTDILTGYISGTSVYPSLRTVDGLGNTICQTDLPRYIIPYPLDDLDITISTVVVNCNELQVTVQGDQGTAPYEYTYSDNPATFNPTTATWTAPTPGNHVFAGLVPGRTYVFYVRDNNGCIRQSNVNVNDITDNPIGIVSSYEPSCSGANDGQITYTLTDFDGTFESLIRWELYNVTTGALVLTSGGTIAYNPVPSQDIIISGLAPAEYYLVVTEVDGGGIDTCVGGSENLLLEELNPITGTPNVLQDITCASPGLIQIQNIVGGGGTYTYTLSSANFIVDIISASNPVQVPMTNLVDPTATPFNIDVSATDQYGCSDILGTVSINVSQNPIIDTMMVDSCDYPISLTINATSAAAQILYSIDGGTTYLNNGGVFTNLVAGTYNIAIIDSNGCTDTDTFDIIAPLEFNVLHTELLDCDPGIAANAEITIEVTSGSGNYEFAIDGPGIIDQARTTLTSNPFAWAGASVAGSYAVTVYDIDTATPNCFETITIDIPDAVVPIFTETHTDITCNGANDGTITLYPTDNGINPLTFTLTPMPVGVVLNGNTFENVPAGTYSVRGTGTNNCFTDIFGIDINEPNVIVVTAPTVVEFGCASGNNPNNAMITVTAAGITGGSGNYVIYEFINDQGTIPTGDDVVVQSGFNTSYVETNVAGGSYSINVYDDNGCLGSTTAIILPFDELLTATAAITSPISCNPGNDGEITIAVTSTTNNTAKFEYSINNGTSYQASNIFTGLPIGTHNFLIRHTDTGCIMTATETLTDPNTFTIDVTKTSDVICFGTTTGAVTFELLDATYPGGFDWEIFNDNGTPINFGDDISVSLGTEATNGPTAVINLAAGSYYVSISQNNFPQCVNLQAFTINGPTAAITANTEVDPITCLGNDGIIEIIDVLGGWGAYSYYIGTIAPTGAGDYVASPQFSALSVGTYQAWVLDSSGCEQMVQNNIVLANPVPITATLQVNQENCINLQGELEIIGVGGGQGTNYTYQLIKDGVDFGAPQNTSVFAGLGAGSYEVRVSDQWSCTFTTTAELLYTEINATSTVVKPIDCTVNPGGEITVNVNGGSANLEYTVIFPDGITTATNNTGVFITLPQVGTYSFMVTDLDTSTPCTATITEELDDKVDPILLNASIVNVSCNGGSDGSITANLDPATNSNPPYQYELIGLAGAPSRPLQNNPFFDGLPVGDYQVRVVSDRGCETTKNETITEPTQLVVSASAIPFACAPDNSVNTSILTVAIPTTGTTPYVYSIDNVNFQTTNTFEIIDNGAVQNITAYVTDANGCSATDAVAIQPLNTFMVAASQNIAISCLVSEEVLITVTDDGNPANNYTYELLPIGNPNGGLTGTPTNTTATFDLTAVGNYTFRITDTATGCYIDTLPYEIAPFDLIEVVATATVPVTCFAGVDGELEIDVTNYAGPYAFEVFTQAGISVQTGTGNTATNPHKITGLSGGNFYVTVTETNAPECAENSNVITIISPDMPLTAIVNPLANVSCTNDQGEILIDPSGGYAPYDIVLNNTTTGQIYNAADVASMLFTGLSEGSFMVTITDTNGCVLNDIETLVAPLPITADITASLATLACYGDTNAVVSAINVLNGSGSYQYQLNYYNTTGTIIDLTTGGQISAVFDNLGAGIYSITVSDGWNCDVETSQVTITDPTEVTASLIRTSPLTCTTQAELELTAGGGTGPYSYSVDGINYFPMLGGNTHTFTVGAGAYRYYVQDSFNCISILSNEIMEDFIDPLVLNIDSSTAFINCNGDGTAVIYADAEGGLGNYQYELFTDISLNLASRIAGPQSNGLFNNLPAGTYYVNVTSEDCTAPAKEVVITEPTPLTYTENVINASCFGDDNGSITITLSGGSGGYQYAISPNLNQFDTINTFTDLAPGDYTIIAQDVNGCFELLEYTITQPEIIQLSAASTPEICIGEENGTISITLTGGTAPYSTSLNDKSDFVQDRVGFVDLAAGSYLLFVRDAQGCEDNIIVEVLPGQNLNATVEPVYECTGDTPNNYLLVTLEDPTVANDIMYALDSTNPVDMQLTLDFTDIAPGMHSLTIAHANGCVNTVDFEILGFEPLTLELQNNSINEITAIATGGRGQYTFYFNDDDNGPDNTYIINHTDTYEVRVVDENGCEVIALIEMEFIDIEIPNFFTPDGDGQNDFWLPVNIEPYPEILIKIYDRYGRVVENNVVDRNGWDGTYHGAELPTGDYWYMIQLQGENDDREFVGHFTLYR